VHNIELRSSSSTCQYPSLRSHGENLLSSKFARYFLCSGYPVMFSFYDFIGLRQSRRVPFFFLTITRLCTQSVGSSTFFSTPDFKLASRECCNLSCSECDTLLTWCITGIEFSFSIMGYFLMFPRPLNMSGNST